MIHRGMFVGVPRKLALAAGLGALCYALWVDPWLVYLSAAGVYLASFLLSQYTFAVLANEHQQIEKEQ